MCYASRNRLYSAIDPSNGADQILGQADDDIVIGGTTSNDASRIALESILAEWTSANTYENRITNIRNGGGANGAFVLSNATVTDDGLADSLFGNADRDWFWSGIKDKINDHATNETIN